MNRWSLFGCAVLPLLVACGNELPKSEARPLGGSTAACRTATDCGAGHTCLQVGAERGCMPLCTGSADACGANASCGGVGVMSVEVCQPTRTEEEASDPEEQPRIPCASDAECGALQPGAICATFQGARDCTIPCARESDCDLPALGGFSMDFLTCANDEGASRLACLPDPACFTNPMSCVSGF